MSPTEESSSLELSEYLRILRRRKWTIALAVIVVVGAALVSAELQTPVYRAGAEVLLQPRSTDTIYTQNSQQSNPTLAVQTEIEIVKSAPVRQAVQKKLGVAPRVAVAVVGQTDVITVSAESTDPRSAATVANAYANAYIDFRRTQDVNDLLQAAGQIQARIADLQHQIDFLNPQIASGGPPAQATIGPQVDNLVQQQGAFKQQLGQLEVSAALRTGGAQLVTPASTPASPAKPRPTRIAVIALAVGLIFGIGLAFLLDHLDDSVKSKDDLDRAARGLPTLALIPRVPARRSSPGLSVVSVTDPKASVSESYRALRTAISFAALERPLQTLQVTSPSASEGKTTTLSNLAVALAQAGQRVIISCCDLRRPRVHEFFGLDNAIGFTSVLLGDVPLSAALQSIDDVPGLRLLASGPLPPNPSELLSSHRAAEVLTALQGQADIVLLDSPPVLPVTDAAVLSGRVDATLLVAAAGTTTRKELTRSIELLSQVGAPIIGTVLNGVTSEGSYGYGYRYYRYEDESAKPNGDGRRRRQEAAVEA